MGSGTYSRMSYYSTVQYRTVQYEPRTSFSIACRTWKLRDQAGGLTLPEIIYESIKLGVRHLDCACDYGTLIIVMIITEFTLVCRLAR
jgi:diketogulonate reductase-like aldo/keto reductase